MTSKANKLPLEAVSGHLSNREFRHQQTYHQEKEKLE